MDSESRSDLWDGEELIYAEVTLSDKCQYIYMTDDGIYCSECGKLDKERGFRKPE